MMIRGNLGAHEVMEIHEVLNCSIDAINRFELYRPYVRDPQLASMLDNQVNFMCQEYNNMVQLIGQKGATEAVPYRAPYKSAAPLYGLRNPAAQTPNTAMNEMNDRDVASGMLGAHKASACHRMVAALECADPQIRRSIQQGAMSCSEQAYEVWQYMNYKGWYQVPTLQDTTMNTMLNTYTMANVDQMNMTMLHPMSQQRM